MPNKSKKSCSYPGCPELVEVGTSYCQNHQKQKEKQYDKQRGSATQRGYNVRWRKARDGYLRENPLCVECLKKNKVTTATVVDHVIPHKGDSALFWDKSNWQSLCKQHHDIKTAKEDGGFGNGYKTTWTM